jgi:hypothetical protein
MTKTATILIYPRIHYYDGTTGYETATSMTDVVVSVSGETSTLTVQYFNPSSASPVTSTEGYIDLKVTPAQPVTLKLSAGVNLTTPDSSGGRDFNGYFKHWGRYDLYDLDTDAAHPNVTVGASTTTSDIAEIDWKTCRIYGDSYLVSGTDYNGTSDRPLTFLSWAEFFNRGYSVRPTLGIPEYVTETVEGRAAFHPTPDRTCQLVFNYTKTPQTLADASDEPTGLPVRFHNVISWRAVMKYATYDSQPALLRRAEEEYERIMRKMRRDLLPKITVTSGLYW